MNASRIAWSCVVDDVPGIWSSLIPWLATLTRNAGVTPECIHVHHVCELQPDIKRVLLELGVLTHRVDAFHPVSPHSNKIRQCFTQFESEFVVLNDVDLAYVTMPPIDDLQASVSGKLVDFPNPSTEILKNIYQAAGIELPRLINVKRQVTDSEPYEFLSLENNFNGGFYVLKTNILKELGLCWSKWANWLIDRVELLNNKPIHIDQVSFSMALSELNIRVDLLPDTWNLPFHLQPIQAGPQPFVIHHHAMLNSDFHLDPNVSLRTQTAVELINQATDDFRAYFGLSSNP